jgi:hypothetical protein
MNQNDINNDDEENQLEKQIIIFKSDLLLQTLQLFQFLLGSSVYLQERILEREILIPRLLSLYSFRSFLTENKAMEFQLNAVLLFLLRFIVQKKTGKKELNKNK